MRPFLGFRALPARAVRSVVELLDADDAFRERVGQDAVESALGRPSWLYLTRPDRWADDLADLVVQADEEHRATHQARAEADALRRAEQLAETVEQLRRERDEALRAAREAEVIATREQAAARSLTAERDDLSARVRRLEEERARAVRELADARTSAAGRLEELRAAQAELELVSAELVALRAAADAAPVTDADGSLAVRREDAAAAHQPVEASRWEGVDPVMIAALIDGAAGAATELARTLAAAAAAFGAGSVPDATAATGSSAGAASSEVAAGSEGGREAPVRRPPRRTPVRLRSGLVEDTPEGLAQLLGTPRLVAVVDGYNVTMEGWHGLDKAGQRDSLVTALGALQARTSATLHAVFDGDADGRRPAVGAPLPVRVHFSPEGTEADDVILDMVTRLPTDVPVLVVSSDRRVADGARRLGANAVPSSVLIELLRRG